MNDPQTEEVFAPPDEDWVVKVYKPALDGRSVETVALDFSREDDLGEVLGWLDTEGWIVLKEVGHGDEWYLARDKASCAAFPPPTLFESGSTDAYSAQYVDRIIEARILTGDDVATPAPHRPVDDSSAAVDDDKMMRLQCIYFVGGGGRRWSIVMARKETGRQHENLETVYVGGGDVYVHSLFYFF